MKVCSKCSKEKPLIDFYKSVKSTGGHRSSCKSCCNAARKEWFLKNKEKNYKNTTIWKENNRDRYNELSRNSRTRQRLRVLEMVGKGILKCSRCGCDVIALLEINHINGGGAQEVKRKNTVFYGKILRGDRSLDDLNILCKMCNILHYVELKFGKQHFRLTWEKNENYSI